MKTKGEWWSGKVAKHATIWREAARPGGEEREMGEVKGRPGLECEGHGIC
jgi:hypothetical protein